MSFYARFGGFDPAARIGEAYDLISRSNRRLELLKGTSIENSSRRFVALLGRAGTYKVWSPDSFTADDECRVRHDYPDITPDKMEEVISNMLGRHADKLRGAMVANVLKSHSRINCERERSGDRESEKMDYDSLRKILTQQITRLGLSSSRILERITDSERLVKELQSFFVPDAVETFVDSYSETRLGALLACSMIDDTDTDSKR
jgi:hypothetical protein